MVTSSSRRSRGPVMRSQSPSGRFHSPLTNESCASAFVASTSSGFSSPSSTFFGHRHDDHHHHHHQHRSASPTRVNLYSSATPAPSFRFSINRSTSPGRSIAIPQHNHRVSIQKKTCMCSPTTHPGSFRCSLHKNIGNNHRNCSGSYPSNRLNMQRSAMTNSLVRIGGVEGEWVKRALSALIRPSSHQQRRRAAFQPGPSRLSAMFKADDI